MNSVNEQLLPSAYKAKLDSLSLAPAWQDLGRLVPVGRPIRHAGPMAWPYSQIRTLLMEASDLVPIEHAERRVLGLANPGLSRLGTTPSMFCGLQLLLPGEHAKAHRHSPAAARLVIEGTGAATRVNDIDVPMEPGDLILTPPHYWHSHHHYGADPVVWLDILDHPISVPMEASYLTGERDWIDTVSRLESAFQSPYVMAGLVPYRSPLQPSPRYPLWRFAWRETRSSLIKLAGFTPQDGPVHMMFVNPETGASLLETLCFSVLMLRPGEIRAMPIRSVSAVCHIVEGDGESSVDDMTAQWQRGDTISCPTFAKVVHSNMSKTRPAFIIQVDDGPMQSKLGFYMDSGDISNL